MVFFEYALDTAHLAHDAGLTNLHITNGCMTDDMIDQFAPCLDAVNVDLKAFRDETYRKYVGARLDPVLRTLKTIQRLGIWLEVTTLVISGIHDDPAELKDAADFVTGELGLDTPWHISRFFPAYEMTDLPPTPLSKLEEACEIGRQAGLRYVYLGNVASGKDTLCPRCRHVLLRCSGYRILENRVTTDGRCPDCGTEIAGVAMAENQAP